MQHNSKECKFFINLATDNVRKKIKLLSDSDKKSLLEEYKEWIRDGLSKNSVLSFRDDPII